MLASLITFLCTQDKKQDSGPNLARNFVNFRPEPESDPKNPARLTTMGTKPINVNKFALTVDRKGAFCDFKF